MLNAANTFKLSSPAAAIAALPALLGFTPELSLVVLLIASGELTGTLRVDLPGGRNMIGTLAYSAATCGADSAIVIVVDADGAPCDMCRDEHRELIAELRTELERRDIELLGAHIVDRVEAGGRWHCWDGCGADGVIDDPKASPLTMQAVLTGRVMHNSRQEIAALFETSDPARTAHLADLLAGPPHDLEEADIAAELTAALAILTAFTETMSLSDSDAARLAMALTDARIRDSLIGLAAGATARQALELWTRLAQLLPGTHRADALTMAAVTSYILGDNPRASIAVDVALRIKPDHRLAAMIDVALTNGLPSEHVRRLGDTGRTIARRYGIEL
ncbi:hypothetical protein A7R75_30260 [Mycolicibacterium llatzerense]|nr:hypothetical protein [Mycolicibacterium llatzerense]